MTEVAKHPWLTRRKDVYYVRAPVPKDILETFGRREVTYSLRTKDAYEAREKIDVEAAKIRRQFDEHGDLQQPCIEAKPVSAIKVPLSPLVLQQICDQHYQSVVDEDFEWRADLLDQVREDGEGFGDGKYIDHPRSDWYNVIYERLDIDDLLLICVREHHQKQLVATEKRLALADIGEHAVLSANLARERDLRLSSADVRKLARKLLEREQQARKDILSGDQRRYDAIVEKCAPSVQPAAQAITTQACAIDPGPTLSALLDPFQSEGRLEGLAVKTLMGDRADLQDFISVAGDKPIRSYTKADAVSFKEVLSACPANRKSTQYRGLNIAECAQLAEELEVVVRRLATTTINDKLNALSKFFGWANNHLGEVANPFEGTRIKVKRKRAKRSEDRLPFNIEELQKVFSATVFTGCKSRTKWKVPGNKVLRVNAGVILQHLAGVKVHH